MPNSSEDLYNSIMGSKGHTTDPNQSPEELYNTVMGAKPTAPKPSWGSTLLGSLPLVGPALGGPLADQLFSDGPLHRIGKAFSQTFEDNYGWKGTTPEIEDDMKKRGIYSDYHDGNVGLLKSFNEGAWRSVISLGVTGMAYLGASTAALGQTGRELKQLGNTVQNLPNQIDPNGMNPWLHGLGAVAGTAFGGPGEFAEELASGALPDNPAGLHPHLETISRARSERVIGESEGSYFGTEEATPEQKAVRQDFINSTPPFPPTLEVAARTSHPELFNVYDRLSETRDLYRTQLKSLFDQNPETNPEYTAVQDKIQEILDKVDGDESKLSKNRTRDIAELRDSLNEIPQKADTPEMADIRSKLQDIDYKMRDLAPSVATAYREAGERLGEAREGFEEPAGTPTTPEENARPEASLRLSETISQRLQDAGRPKQEADLAATLVEAYYRTMSARFEGRLGTPEELFEKNFPDLLKAIDKPKSPLAKELAQYVGRRAYVGRKTATMTKFFDAERMEGQGKSPEEIRQATGWFRNKLDGKWRHEISDQGATLTPAFENLPESKIFGDKHEIKLNEALNHPELFELYPELKDTTIKKQAPFMDIWQSTQGWFDHAKNEISITPYAKEPLSVLLHEIQHWIQSKEDFARGGNTSTVLENLTPEKLKELLKETIEHTQEHLNNTADTIKEIQNVQAKLTPEDLAPLRSLKEAKEALWWEYLDTKNEETRSKWYEANNTYYRNLGPLREKLFGTERYSELTKAQQNIESFVDKEIEKPGSLNDRVEGLKKDFVNTTDKLAKLQSGDLDTLKKSIPSSRAFKLYENIAGEIEARDTQARMGLTDAERLATEPLSSQEIDPNDVTVSYNQERRGSIILNKDGRNLIKFFEKADASTFMHEMGHQFLENLREWSSHPDAPADVVLDSKIIHDWLKADENKPLTEKQHEQFARGFERYLREGRAPSEGLARVFYQFKQWLTDIYKRVTQLNVKLSDDVRDVFARMLSEDPNYKGYVLSKEEYEAAPTPEEQNNVLPLSNKSPEGEVTEPKEAKTDPTLENSAYAPTELGQSKYIDKDGKAIFDSITSDKDLKNYMVDYSNQYNNFFKGRRADFTASERLEMADMLGASPRRMNANLNKLSKLFVQDDIPVHVRFYALKDLMKQNALRAKDMVLKDDPMGYLDAQILQNNLMKTFMSIRTEWGRIGKALQAVGDTEREAEQMSEFLQSTVGKSFDQVKIEMEALKPLDNEAAISKQLIKTAKKPGWGWMPFEWLLNDYVSGPITHSTYSFAQKQFMLMKYTASTLTASGISALKGLFTELKPGERVYAREAITQAKELYNQWAGIQAHRDGWRAAKAAFLTREMPTLPGENSAYDMARKAVLREIDRYKDQGLLPPKTKEEMIQDRLNKIIAKTVNAQVKLEGLTGLAADARKEELIASFDTKKSLVNSVDNTYSTRKMTPGLAGDIVRAPSELMVTPLHTFDRAIAFQVKLRGLATRQALDEGLTGKALAAREADLYTNPPDEMMAQARDDAMESALLGSKGDFTSRYQHFLNTEILGVPWFRFIQAFTGIPLQIIKMANVDYGPGGILAAGLDVATRGKLGTRISGDLLGKNGSARQAEAWGKIGVGMSLMMATYALQKTGHANAGPDPDWKKAKVDLMVNGLPHSIKIGGMSYAFDRLGIQGMMMANATDLAAAEQLAEDGDYKNAVTSIGLSFLGNTKEVYSGFSDLFEAIDGTNKAKSDNYIDDKILGFVPVGSSQVAHLIDPNQREARTFIDKLKSKIPFVSEGLEEKVDLFGQPVPSKEWWGIYATEVQNDPVAQFLEKAGYFPAPVKHDINGVELTDKQYHDYAVLAGTQLRFQLQFLMKMPGFFSMPPKQQHALVSNAVSTSRSQAAQTIMAMPENADLMRNAILNKYGLLDGFNK